MSNSPQRMQVDVGALECPVRIDDEMIGEWTLTHSVRGAITGFVFLIITMTSRVFFARADKTSARIRARRGGHQTDWIPDVDSLRRVAVRSYRKE